MTPPNFMTSPTKLTPPKNVTSPSNIISPKKWIHLKKWLRLKNDSNCKNPTTGINREVLFSGDFERASCRANPAEPKAKKLEGSASTKPPWVCEELSRYNCVGFLYFPLNHQFSVTFLRSFSPFWVFLDPGKVEEIFFSFMSVLFALRKRLK